MPHLTKADVVLLKNLEKDISDARGVGEPLPQNLKNFGGAEDANNATLELDDDESTMKQLAQLREEQIPFSTWDNDDINVTIRDSLILPYVSWASRIVRKPVDVVFLTHILIHFTILLPSAVYLFYNFSWFHGVLHWALQTYCAGPFTLLLHNHIHNGGVLAKKYSGIDGVFPYILGPLMGHTWNSYYYHHAKHHHVENNGPGDLSSTIRYQRDSLPDFLHYLGRFLTLTWIELPIYFARKGQIITAVKCLSSELGSVGLMLFFARLNLRSAAFVFLWPLFQMRVGMMVGNWGQHALVDNVEPTSDFRSSITLIDEASNRHCFNDGYHTSHHLNPRRHWRDHPLSFLKTKHTYAMEGAFVFRDIDYLMITVRLLRKDYNTLANNFVPMGEQISLTHDQKVALLKSRTRRFTEDEIRLKFKTV